ncbi:MAG: c-type cytochrome [Chitinophagaceae bacterium]
MKFSKRISVLLVLAGLVIIGVAATKPENNYKNLKVLPKDISHEELGKVMHDFNNALGVKCNFCHAEPKQGEQYPDFASDEKPEKSVARSMIKMTNRINKKFFHGKSKIGDPNALVAVNCATCHHGSPHPEAEAPKEEPKN